MKKTIGVWMAAIAFVCTLGMAQAFASPSHMAYGKSVEVTGCLRQGPVAKEYLINGSDGSTCGINELDVYLNHYVGEEVTVAGNVIRPTSSERQDGGAHHHLQAKDVVVDSQHCQR